ncbi:MAG: hypothetical protein AAB550_01845 [Patescibacteria group bacterium]
MASEKKLKNQKQPIVKVDLKTQWQNFLKVFTTFFLVGGDLI